MRGGRGRAIAGEATLGGEAGSRGSNGGTAAHQPQLRADADGLGFGVTTTATVCAVSGAEGAQTVREWREGDMAESVRYVNWAGRTKWGTGAARDPPVLRRGIQGGQAAGLGARDGGGQVEEDAGRGAPGGGPGVSQGTGEKAQGANAQGAVAEGGVVMRGTWVKRGRGIARDRRGSAWATGCRAGPEEGAERAERMGCGLRAWWA